MKQQRHAKKPIHKLKGNAKNIQAIQNKAGEERGIENKNKNKTETGYKQKNNKILDKSNYINN